ncbi:MAG: bifunctional glutamate N-acetyltransferase/amino-acid acetyltransferase ArgJ [Peptococcaceae bacterium]|nr:bifunctional glutamate N-acetyltransferase/amino-acid acetyltransferase ArgJ [Peptococcaceae bacterium]
MKFEAVPGGVTAAVGFTASGVAAGVKYKGKKDIAVIYSECDAAAAGVFTTNVVKAAPVILNMERLTSGRARAVVVNSGNANACNGDRGMADARAMAEEAARLLGIPGEAVLVASTGVIGQPMPMDRIIPGIGSAVANLSRAGGTDAAEAIMTTDTELKQHAVSFCLDGKRVTVGGMAKGSGMIHPNMATMLCFVTTDAAISPACLKECLAGAVDRSFNMVTVDGDTSTNDMVVALANGMAGNREIGDMGEDGCRVFREALTEVCVALAKAVARDGEGATKLIEVRVVNAPEERDARLAARGVAASSLFKAAVFGEDANWGRIICAAGYSGARFNPRAVDIYLGDVQVARDGEGLAFDEEKAASVLAQKEVRVLIDFKEGDHEATAWGCDLTYEYVKINGSYRT